jgi:uncharacterized membrane protein YhiD involved in acid resistance
VLSAVIAFTYEQTTLVNVRNYGLMQTFILSALIATMVLQAIGDNVASGLGMLGALTVVQFRTNLRNPRYMIFMFASLGTGIACGLYGFLIALMGVTFFCVVVFMIRYSPFHFSHMPVWNLKLKGEDSVFRNPNFKQLLAQYCLYHTLESVEPDKDGSKIWVMQCAKGILYWYSADPNWNNKRHSNRGNGM